MITQSRVLAFRPCYTELRYGIELPKAPHANEKHKEELVPRFWEWGGNGSYMIGYVR